LRVGDFDAKRGKLEIRHGVEGGEGVNAPLFVVRRNRSFNSDALRHLIKSATERAGVKKAYPYKFRHTFAITYLRSGVMFVPTVAAWARQPGHGSSLCQDCTG